MVVLVEDGEAVVPMRLRLVSVTSVPSSVFNHISIEVENILCVAVGSVG